MHALRRFAAAMAALLTLTDCSRQQPVAAQPPTPPPVLTTTAERVPLTRHGAALYAGHTEWVFQLPPDHAPTSTRPGLDPRTSVGSEVPPTAEHDARSMPSNAHFTELAIAFHRYCTDRALTDDLLLLYRDHVIPPDSRKAVICQGAD